MTDEGIDQVLAEIRAVATDLVEIKADLKNATTHLADVDLLRSDVEVVKEHLEKLDKRIDALVNGPPALEERLARLEVKQETDDTARQEDDAETRAGAGTADDTEHRKSSRKQADTAVGESEARQELINVEFRKSLGRVEGAIFDILHASLKIRASIILGAIGLIYVLMRMI